ncbi:MAG: FtsX-like permease family protein [Bacteroidetes bacterium]|nr:FtsX-like permease family protein [Bacteroidota bacterium]
MNLYNIAIHSLKRKKSKTAFLIIGLVLAVSSVVTLITVSEIVNRSVATNLDEFGANIVISPKSDELSLNYGGLTVGGVSISNNQLKNEDILSIKKIKNKDNISIIAPKLLNTTNIEGKKSLVAGINVNEELKLKKWWKVIGKKSISKSEALVGLKIKEKLNIRLDQIIKINSREFTVVGIIEETGSQDDSMIFINLDEAQSVFNQEEKLSLIEVAALCYDCPIEEIVTQTSNQLPLADVTAIRQTIESKMTAIHSFEHFSFGLSMVILIISMLIVFTNVNASVSERTAEIGVFKAIGFTRNNITTIIIFEVFLSSLIAGVIGYVIGIYASRVIAPILSMNSSLNVEINIYTLIIATFLSLIIGVLSSLYPVYRANKLDPTVAFRSL